VTILSFTTIAICPDRNHIVANPLSQRSGWAIFGQIVGIWVASCILMIPLGLSGSVEQTMSSSHDNPSTAIHCIEVTSIRKWDVIQLNLVLSFIQSWTRSEAQMGYSVTIFLVVHLLPILIMIRGDFKISYNFQRCVSEKVIRKSSLSCVF